MIYVGTCVISNCCKGLHPGKKAGDVGAGQCSCTSCGQDVLVDCSCVTCVTQGVLVDCSCVTCVTQVVLFFTDAKDARHAHVQAVTDVVVVPPVYRTKVSV